MARNAPTNSDDIIDSRDIIARIEELEELETAIKDAEEFLEASGDDERERAEELLENARADMDDEDREELRVLRALAEVGESAADWAHGETLIRDSYFKTYAQEFADSIGAIPEVLNWPCSCIDWEQAARELQMDYFSVEFDGVTYWIR